MMVGGREVSGSVLTSEMLVAEAREVGGQGSVEEGRDPVHVCVPGDEGVQVSQGSGSWDFSVPAFPRMLQVVLAQMHVTI